MGSVRVRSQSGLLFFDFRFQGIRCREQTMLPESAENRKRMEATLKRIEAEITLGTFRYEYYFPNSVLVDRFTYVDADQKSTSDLPPLSEFAWQWFQEKQVEWKRSYRDTIKGTLSIHLVPQLGDQSVDHIRRPEILQFRISLAEAHPRTGRYLSPDRINHILTPLRMILEEAAIRFDFPNPWLGIKPLKIPKFEVDPFSLDEVMTFLASVRKDFKQYYTVRFFTGLRTAEIDGLKWEYVDLDRKLIVIHETLVNGRPETPKAHASYREVQMNTLVHEALSQQKQLTSNISQYVFCNGNGNPLDHRNMTRRVWYPTLRLLNMKRRRPYQTRHTAATLWLAAGENPSWIARQLGHSTTRMLFERYARFVPNLTHRDGSAFEKFLLVHQTQTQETQDD